MYEIIKAVIISGRYELKNMLNKIDTVWLQGNLNDAQKTELVSLAREQAVPENSYAGIQKQIESIYANMAEMAKRITALEGGTSEPPRTEEWPEYVQPTGAHDAYGTGDKITFRDTQYTCKMDGCVWDPETYPEAWEKSI